MARTSSLRPTAFLGEAGRLVETTLTVRVCEQSGEHKALDSPIDSATPSSTTCTSPSTRNRTQ
jgi:hypothetical protein